MDLEPLKTFRASTNQASLLRHDGRLVLVKEYAGERPQERRDCEEQSLRAWKEAGFPVPELFAVELPASPARGPFLAMSHVQGVTLQEILQDAGRPLVEKFALLEEILRSGLRRHQLACEQRQPRLIHPDPNTSNILCPDSGGFVFIDFETTGSGADLEESAAVELAKLCRWAARDLGVAHLPALMRQVVGIYRARPGLLRRLVARTHDRPLQFFHRWQDSRRRRRNPRDVTKYQLADALAAELARAGSPGRGPAPE